MPTSFQPERPHGTAHRTTGKSTIIWVAVISALLVTMLFALGLPHMALGYDTSWAMTIGAGVVTLVVVLAIGYWKHSQTSVAD